MFRHLKTNLGYSLVELSVAIGLSSLVALGTGQMLYENIKAGKSAERTGAASSLAEEIRNEINGAATRRLMFDGINRDGNAATDADRANCGGVLQFEATGQSAINSLFAPPYTSAMKVKLHNTAGIEVGASAGESLQKSSYGGTFRVLSLDLTNAAIIGSDQNMTIISGELYVAIGTESEHTAGRQSKRRQYIGRVTLKHDAATGNILDCNIPSTTGSLISYCASEIGKVYDPINNACTYAQTEELADKKLDYPNPGTQSVLDSDDDEPITSAIIGSSPTRDSDGNIITANIADTAIGYGPDGFIIKRMDQINNPPVLPPDGVNAANIMDYSTLPNAEPGVDKTCQPYWDTYRYCLANPAFSDNGIKCNQPPKVGCVDIRSLTPPKAIIKPAAPINPTGTKKCDCAGTMIDVGKFCGYCSNHIMLGLDNRTDKFSLKQCSAEGNFITTHENTLPDPTLVNPARCRNTWFVVPDGNVNDAKIGNYDW